MISSIKKTTLVGLVLLASTFFFSTQLIANQSIEGDGEVICQFQNKKNPTFKKGCKPAPGWVCHPC